MIGSPGMKKIIRIAHRGGGGGLHENKIETIKKTLKENTVDAIEVDVRKTKDNIIVLSHSRGITINGRTKWIDKVNFEDIKHLGIATLQEVISLFAASNKILDIDVKEKNTGREIVRLLKNNRYFKRIYFSSFDLATLFEIQEEMPNGQYFLSSSIKDSRDLLQRRIIRIFLVLSSIVLARIAVFILKRKVKKIKLDGISLFYRFATQTFVDYLKTFGFKIFVWGTDNEKDLKKIASINIDGIKTKKTFLFKRLIP